jgi:hypothetical protein
MVAVIAGYGLIGGSGFNVEDTWGHRAGEPNKAVICSLALARLRTDKESKDSNVVGMAQKLLLFWRKPAVRRYRESFCVVHILMLVVIAALLVGRPRVGGRRGSRGETEGVDPPRLDPGNGRFPGSVSPRCVLRLSTQLRLRFIPSSSVCFIFPIQWAAG